MVRRDRNHPCVITYSIGNEITERDGSNQGAEWSAKLAAKVRQLDATRFVTSAVCGVFPEKEEGSNFDRISSGQYGLERGDEGISVNLWIL